MTTVAIVQARMGSTRLPGKVLVDLAGAPMLARVMHRVARATTLDGVWVATTNLPGDDVLAGLCLEHGWPCFRGSADDVLDRYHQAAGASGADIVVRVTADCPLIEPAILDRVVGLLSTRPDLDYACNWLPRRSFPRGLDVEALRRATLERAWREATEPAEREHVTPYVYRHPERFHLAGIEHDRDLADLRWTVDTPEDLMLIRRIYEHFGHDRFSWREALAVLAEHPEWSALNRHVVQKPV